MIPSVAAAPACSGCCWKGRGGAAAAAASQLQQPFGVLHPRRPRQRLAVVRAAAAEKATTWTGGSGSTLAAAKQRLLAALAGTERGAEARSLRRGEVEEAQVRALALPHGHRLCTSATGTLLLCATGASLPLPGQPGSSTPRAALNLRLSSIHPASQVAVEAFSSGSELDFSLLQGRWRLEYTTARDVLPLVAPARGPLPPPLQVLQGRDGRAHRGLPRAPHCRSRRGAPTAHIPPTRGAAPNQPAVVHSPWCIQCRKLHSTLPLPGVSPQIGRIYQAFSGTEGGGTVQNIIEARLPPALPLLPRDVEAGVTLVVEAGWEARTARSIALTFRCVGESESCVCACVGLCV